MTRPLTAIIPATFPEEQFARQVAQLQDRDCTVATLPDGSREITFPERAVARIGPDFDAVRIPCTNPRWPGEFDFFTFNTGMIQNAEEHRA